MTTTVMRTASTAFLLLLILTTGAHAQGGCDRSCLRGHIDHYLTALAAGNPDGLPLAGPVTITEDNRAITTTEGAWANDIELTDYRIDILDMSAGVAAALTLLRENGDPVMYALRLVVADGGITGVETMAVRNREEGMIFRPDALVEASAAMTAEPDPALLTPRDEMVNIAIKYPEGLKTGSFVTADVPFTADAYRFENGQLMAGPGCTFFPGCENIKTQRIPTLAGITHRVAAVDEQLGIVLLRMNFGPGSTFQGDGVLDVWEAFKIHDGQVHAVEAFMEITAAGKRSIWD